jgi:integrase
MPLTVKQVKNAKPLETAYKLTDAKGMFALVHPNGSKYWRMDYRFGQKRKTLSLGVYPDVSLSEARDLVTDARTMIRKGIDPMVEKKKAKYQQSGENSFRSVALDWFEKQMTGYSDRHRQRAMSILTVDLFPVIGDSSVSDISAPDLLIALRKIEARGAIEIAHRARTTAGQIFRYAIASGLCERDVSADLRDALTRKPKVEHRAAITDPDELRSLIIAIDGYQGTPVVCAALKLSALFFQRPGEIRQMEWAEINWEDEVWFIPGAKMKLGLDHIVPLSKQALKVLYDLHALTGRGKYAFPSQRGPSRPLSDNGVRTAIRTMGFDAETMSAHGFRATARTILDEVLHVRVDFIEHQQSRKVKDPTGRAYNRTRFLLERKEMMQLWADYLDQITEAA